MSVKRTLRKIRRWIVVLALLAGMTYGIIWIITNAGKWVQGKKTPSRTASGKRIKRPKKSKPIEEGLFDYGGGQFRPGIVQARLDIIQFVQRGLVRVTGTYARDYNSDYFFDGRTATTITFDSRSDPAVLVEFRNPQYLTGFQLITEGSNFGRWHVEAVIERKDDFGNITHSRQILAQNEGFKSGKLSVKRLKTPMPCKSLRLVLEKNEPDRKVTVCSWDIYGLVQISGVQIAADKRQIRLNKSTECRLAAKDINGLVLNGLKDIQWKSDNPVVAQVSKEGKVSGFKEGEASIVADLYGVRSNSLSFKVFLPKDSPTGIIAKPMHKKVYLEWVATSSKFLSHYRIYRRTERGQFGSKHIGKTFQNSFTDKKLTPGQTYYYRVEAFSLDGKRISTPSEEISVTTSKDKGIYSTLPSTEVLVLLYREGLNDYRVKQRKRGLDEAKLFYYRNTKGRLLFDMRYYEIHALPPETAGPTPDSPTMANIATDCLKRGVEHGQFDIIYATGNGLAGCWGGFGILGGRGAFGDAASVPYPTRDMEIDRPMIWSFTHECHHAFDGVCDTAGPWPMYGCHFPDNWPLETYLKLDAGTHYDGIAEILREYPNYDLREPFKQEVEFLDFDQDGFPDSDPRFPMDEERFGSRPDKADTDDDGLSDLEEFYAGIFTGSDPNNVDTDGDGIKDGEDKYPIYNVSEVVPYYPAGHAIDGILEPGWSKFSEGLAFSNDPKLKVRTYMSYNEEYLFIAFDSNKRLKAFIEIDGSGEDGRWASPSKFAGSDNENKKLSKSDSYAENAAFMVEHGKRYVLFGGERMDFDVEKQERRIMGRGKDVGGAIAASGTRDQKNENSYGHILEVRIPRKLPPGAAYTYFPSKAKTIDGLQLKPGQIMGFNFYVGDHNDMGGSQFSGLWGSVFETFHFVDATLSDESDLDGDGLNAMQESQRGTDPMVADTDGDGLIDSRDSMPIKNLLR